jgi:hypothetical protein
MSNVTEKIKENPLQTITVIIAVAGVFFSIANFYLLSNIAPIERRVAAIEDRNAHADPLVDEFIEQRGKISAMQEDIGELRSDMKYLIQIHTNR